MARIILLLIVAIFISCNEPQVDYFVSHGEDGCFYGYMVNYKDGRGGGRSMSLDSVLNNPGQDSHKLEIIRICKKEEDSCCDSLLAKLKE